MAPGKLGAIMEVPTVKQRREGIMYAKEIKSLPRPATIHTKYFNVIYELQADGSYRKVVFDPYNGCEGEESENTWSKTLEVPSYKLPNYIIKMMAKKGV